MFKKFKNYGYEKCYECVFIKECVKCKKEHNNRVDKCDHCCNRFKCGVCADCGKKCNEKYKNLRYKSEYTGNKKGEIINYSNTNT